MPLTHSFASWRARDYRPPMVSALLRLLALVALLFMPLSMAGPAMAEPAPTASAGHCDEHEPLPDQPVHFEKIHCAACAALPAIEAPVPADELRPEAPKVTALSDILTGVEPDIATPPPRTA